MKVSICTTLLDRSAIPHQDGFIFAAPYMVKSMAQAVRHAGVDAEFLISDWGSTDWDPREWLPDTAGDIPHKVIHIPSRQPRYPGMIDRGAGRNIAAAHARGDILVFVDADLYFRHDFLEHALSVVSSSTAYVPQCFYTLSPDDSKGWWDKAAAGTMVLASNMCAQRRWPQLPQWRHSHGEDPEYLRGLRKRYNIRRPPDHRFAHLYHPSPKIDRVLKRHARKVMQAPKEFDYFVDRTQSVT